MNEHLLEKNKEKFKKLNITKWQKQGITGKKIKVGIIGYSPYTHHNGAELIKQVAQDCIITEYNVMDKDSYRYTWEEAFKKMLKDDVQVICCSLRKNTWNDNLQRITQELYIKNVIMIDSSDNEGEKIDAYPALDKRWFAIGVYDGKGRTGYSSYGENLLGLGYSDYAVKNKNNDYIPLSHTSGSVQVIAGIAAMLKQINNNLTPKQFEIFMANNAIKLSTKDFNIQEGYGLLSLPSEIPNDILLNKNIKEDNNIKNNVKFKDVSDTRWSKDNIELISNMKIMNGYPDGTFKPEKTVAREELATVIANMIRSIKRGEI